MPRRPPTSTLFPYTTLFRSTRSAAAYARTRQRQTPQTAHKLGSRERRRTHRGGEDRKSTRLNSSHSSISYAVFCLKKKTKLRAVRQPPVQLDESPPLPRC